MDNAQQNSDLMNSENTQDNSNLMNSENIQQQIISEKETQETPKERGNSIKQNTTNQNATNLIQGNIDTETKQKSIQEQQKESNFETPILVPDQQNSQKNLTSITRGANSKKNILSEFLSKKYNNKENRIKLQDLTEAIVEFLNIIIQSYNDGNKLISNNDIGFCQTNEEFTIELNSKEENLNKKKTIKFFTNKISLINENKDIELDLQIKPQTILNQAILDEKKAELLKLLNGDQDLISKTTDSIISFFKKNSKPAMEANIITAKNNLIDSLYQVNVLFKWKDSDSNKEVTLECTLNELIKAKLSYRDELSKDNFYNEGYADNKKQEVLKIFDSNEKIILCINDKNNQEENQLIISPKCIEYFKYFLENEAQYCLINNNKNKKDDQIKKDQVNIKEKKLISEVLLNHQQNSELTLIDFTKKTEKKDKTITSR